MSENREKREEQIQRLAESLAKAEAYNDPAWWRATAARLYDAGARIPDPPTPAAPEVCVTEEALAAYRSAWGSTDTPHDGTRTAGLRLAFPLLLAANQWAVDAEIRRRVEALSTTIWYGKPLVRMPRADGVGPVVSRADLLAALGVAP